MAGSGRVVVPKNPLLVLVLVLLTLVGSQSVSESRWISERWLEEAPLPRNQREDSESFGGGYVCAKYCTCSLVQANELAPDGKLERRLNLTRAKCEGAQFADLLAIDRRTQIIQISLPPPEEEPMGTRGHRFRMPRLVQFVALREIAIVNLRFEVCDSEVFKRGQRLRRLQLNHNRLQRISKACLRHLDKLTELNLDHNHLDELESALFNSLLSLRSLSLAHNRLSELAAHQFANLTQLISLNLVGNSFKTINLHLFEPMQNSLRLLMLAQNQIKSFVHSATQTEPTKSTPAQNQTFLRPTLSPFAGVVFRQLVKLNVDQNKFERIKLLQLHRFFNIKFLSVRHNQVSSIRDKAFNGLKLIELNLAHNKLQSVSRCAFCNSTIKRLVLANNNISLPSGAAAVTAADAPRPLALTTSSLDHQNESMASAQPLVASAEVAPSGALAASSQNMLILSQSIFGPLFGQLEYLDLSYNLRLADQLELLLEPLLKLEFLNLASVGLEPQLPSPTLFKNLRQLRYLNLSQNQLDQLVAETVEPLQQLEVLDLSQNKFSELDESLLVAVDDLPGLKVINLSQNPWYCSQCKVAPLYDWILRSPIYNQTCIAPSSEESDTATDSTALDSFASTSTEAADNQEPADNNDINNLLARGPHDYGLLLGGDDSNLMTTMNTKLDFDLILSHSLPGSSEPQEFQVPSGGQEEDKSVLITMQFVNRLPTTSHKQFAAADYCLKCEFPGELRSFKIHELGAGDFKFCAGAARITASEPKIGLTLGLVIIGVLFCIIIVVIVMYRNKSKTYYTNELTDDTDRLETANKKPVFSISSDGDQRYGDATDYSSPPMSQSFESTTPDEEEEADDEELDEEEDEEEEELDEDEEEEDELDEVEERQPNKEQQEPRKPEQKTSSSQSNRSSLSPNDRSASGPVHQQRKHSELAKRQASAHVAHNNNHGGGGHQHQNSPSSSSSSSPKQPSPIASSPPKQLPAVAATSKMAWRRSRSSTQQSGGSSGRPTTGVVSASFAGASTASEDLQQPTELMLQPTKLPVAATAAIAAATVASQHSRPQQAQKLEQEEEEQQPMKQYRRGGPRGQTVHERRRPEPSDTTPLHEHRLDRPQSSSNLRPQVMLQEPRQQQHQQHQHQKRPQSPHLGRQKFAFGSTSRQETAQGNVDEPTVSLQPLGAHPATSSKAAELLQMEPRDWFPSPAPSGGDSMATTADSLALEALDELEVASSELDEDDDLHHRDDRGGPALEAEPSDTEEEEEEMMQTAAIRGADHSQPHSAHSALTQTGPSRDEE